MLSATVYSFRLKSRLAISLSWIAGYTNVITLLIAGAVVSHVTGNVTHLGRGLAEFDRHATLYFGFLIASFFSGAIASAMLTEAARRRGLASKYILPMGLEAVLLLALAMTIKFAGLERQGGLSPGDVRHTPHLQSLLYWISGLSSFAMGLQNATITRISGAVVRTTHLTGVVTDLALEGVQYLWWARDKVRAGGDARAGRVLRISRRHPSVLRIALLASIAGSFFFGVAAGAFVFEHVPAYAMLAPVAFLLWIVYVDWRKPIADVRELDATRDGDLDAAELKSMLPPEIGVFRLFHHRRDASHHAPDFQLWVDRLPKQWRIVILAVSPLTHFDPDAVLDLQSAVERLRSSGRELVVCGVNRSQYKVLASKRFPDFLGLENFAPDIEFAVARGLNLLAELALPPNR